MIRGATSSLLFAASMTFTAMILSASAAAQTSGSYEQAMEGFRAGNYAAAAELFAQTETASPGATDALLFRGKCLIKLQKYAEAGSALRQYLLTHANSEPALYLLGFVLNHENKPAESLEIYTKAAALKPPTGDDLKIVGLDYVLLNDYESAIHWLEKAVEFDPGNHEAWYFLGRAYYTKSRIPEARKAFLKTLELRPDDAKAENNLGLILEAEARPEEAMEAYRRAITWQEGNARPSEQPHLNLGRVLLDQDRAAEAIAPLETAARLGPAVLECRLELGTAYLRVNRLKEARHELEEATRLAPENAAAHFQLGKLYKKMQDLDRAKKEFARAEEIQSRAAAPVAKPKE